MTVPWSETSAPAAADLTSQVAPVSAGGENAVQEAGVEEVQVVAAQCGDAGRALPANVDQAGLAEGCGWWIGNRRRRPRPLQAPQTHRRGWTLADRLQDERRRLGELAADDLAVWIFILRAGVLNMLVDPAWCGVTAFLVRLVVGRRSRWDGFLDGGGVQGGERPRSRTE